jgi:hypothetical protein
MLGCEEVSVTSEPRPKRRFSGVALGLSGFALGFMAPLPLLLVVFSTRESGDWLVQLCACSGLFVAALVLGLASRFDRLRTDGGRIELFPKDAAVAPAPLTAQTLLDEIADAATFVQEQARDSRNT